MHKKRGQVSVEFVITVGFAFLMIIPLTILLYEHTTSTYENVNNNQAGLIARKITDSADSVYYLGHPSAMTLEVYMPEDIRSINITGREIVFKLDSSTEIVRTAAINLTGNLTAESGTRFIRISALEKEVRIQDVQP